MTLAKCGGELAIEGASSAFMLNAVNMYNCTNTKIPNLYIGLAATFSFNKKSKQIIRENNTTEEDVMDAFCLATSAYAHSKRMMLITLLHKSVKNHHRVT